MATNNRNRTYAYEIYIGATPAKVWRGLTEADFTRQYVYGTRFQSTLKQGARYAYLGDSDFKVVDGEILEVLPEQRLSMTWSAHWDPATANDRASRVTLELAAAGAEATKLRVIHDDFDGETATYKGSVAGWPLMLSLLKTLLESGRPLAIEQAG